MVVNSSINPTEREAKLFKVLTDTLEHENLTSVLRCAGGWVRDKLLGLESDDIDIAVDNMLGKEFAEHVNSFLESQNLEVRKVAVIMSNPEQSKHLETARMRLDGLELDLVNLRSETYADSRIPEMAFGTAVQDAERRDFTINSLFFNLNTSQVEDLTEKGLNDLEEGIIRTPLPASQTFLDDPLRVLRALRFAARFDFALDESLQEAAASPEVREALAKKVSRERMGVELEKMFTGQGPARAMQDLERLRLLPAVFQVPDSASAAVGTSFGANSVRLIQAASQLLEDWQTQSQPFSKEERRLALMAAFLLPLAGIQVPLKGKRTQTLSSHILLSSIKWRTSDAAFVDALHVEASALYGAFRQLQDGDDASETLRVTLGRSLRVLKGSRWRVGILIAALSAMREGGPIGSDSAEAAVELTTSSSSAALIQKQESRKARTECCRQLESAVHALGLNGCWDWKPLLHGNEIMKQLNVKGPAVGKLTAKLTDFQLGHPNATPEEALSFLQQNQTAQ